MYVYIQVGWIRMHIRMYIYIYMYVYTCMYVHICISISIYIYMLGSSAPRAHWALVGPPRPLWDRPLWAPLGPCGPPWALVGSRVPS